MSIARFRGVCLHCGHDHDADNEAFKAALATRSESAPIPEGWKLVPVELTEPMRIAGYLYKPKLEARCLYRALLDAAPQVPA